MAERIKVPPKAVALLTALALGGGAIAAEQGVLFPTKEISLPPKDGTQGPGISTPGQAGGYGAGGVEGPPSLGKVVKPEDGTQGPGISTPGQAGGYGAGSDLLPKER